KAWSVGSVLDQSLAQLAQSARLKEVRNSIYHKVVAPRHGRTVGLEAERDREVTVDCGPCDPSGGTQCNPWCWPGQQCFPCNPNGGQPCDPNGRCAPR